MSDTQETQLIFESGSDVLQLVEGGKEFHPGDVMPKNLSEVRRVNLQASGIRFRTVHHEPVLTPDGDPAEIAAADQIPEGAVIAAVEAAPAAAVEERTPRRAVKES